MRREDIAIIIPLYHLDLKGFEEISLEQSIKVFQGYDIWFVIPESLNTTNIHLINKGLYTRFPDTFFSSVVSYNLLMTEVFFYKRFEQYKYILICQLDSFVFENRLLEFCNKGYDYYGAPWLQGVSYCTDVDKKGIFMVGNGGFSLRSVNACIRVLENDEKIDHDIPEDLFWASRRDDFKVAPLNVAVDFSMELYAPECFNLNNCRLPFGCHQWHLYHTEFWKPFIEDRGYRIPEEYIVDSKQRIIDGSAYRGMIPANKGDIESFLDRFVANDKERKLYIWGCGQRGKVLGWFFLHNQIVFEAYIDIKEREDRIWGKTILPVKDLPDRCIVVITPRRYEIEIEDQIQKMGKKGITCIQFTEMMQYFNRLFPIEKLCKVNTVV